MENNQSITKELLQCKVSVESVSSTCSDSTTCTDYDNLPPWRLNSEAKKFCVKALTSTYALLLTMVSLVIEVSPTWESEKMWWAHCVFSIWMYGTAVLFFVYLYFFVMYPTLVNGIIKFLNNKLFKKSYLQYIDSPIYNGEGAGTLYLRLGVLFFGTLGSIIWGTEIVLCFFNVRQSALYVIKYILALLFTFIQMIFIICYSKLTLQRSSVIARFGLMHCVAVNLWTWFSLCLAKGLIKKLKKAQKYNLTSSSSSSEEDEIYEIKSSPAKTGFSFEPHGKQLRSIMQMGGTSNIMLTSLVEFSLIGAAICYIIWKTKNDPDAEEKRIKRKHEFKFDYRSSYIGIFLGIILHIISVVTLVLYGIFTGVHYTQAAILIIGYSEILMFAIGILSCGLALFRMRKLQYRLHAHGEAIDEILLIIGLAGEMIYSCVGLDLYMGEMITNGTKSTIVYTAFVLRIVQVVVQTYFILLASRLRSLSQNNMNNQPGKQVVTFLLVTNINLFIYHSFEAMESSFGFPDKLPATYDGILAMCSPIVIFYRFHSSACLAEIWKHAYTNRVHSVEKMH